MQTQMVSPARQKWNINTQYASHANVICVNKLTGRVVSVSATHMQKMPSKTTLNQTQIRPLTNNIPQLKHSFSFNLIITPLLLPKSHIINF